VPVSTSVPHSTGSTPVQHGHSPLACCRLRGSCGTNGNGLLLCWLTVCWNEVRLQAVTHTPCTTTKVTYHPAHTSYSDEARCT